MCEIKTLLIAATLPLAAGFCIYRVNSEKKFDTTVISNMKVLLKKSTGVIVGTVVNAII